MPIAIPPLPAIPSIGNTPIAQASSSGANGASVAGTDFMSQLGQAIDSLQQQQTATNAQALSVASGTGNIANYMVSAEQTNLATQLTDTLSQKATAAFNLIMSTQF